jgi:hypothetical protein
MDHYLACGLTCEFKIANRDCTGKIAMRLIREFLMQSQNGYRNIINSLSEIAVQLQVLKSEIDCSPPPYRGDACNLGNQGRKEEEQL